MKIHVVQPEDTWSKLASDYGVEVEKLLQSNPILSDLSTLEVGTKIKIPSGGIRVTKSVQPQEQLFEYEQQGTEEERLSISSEPPMPRSWYYESMQNGQEPNPYAQMPTQYQQGQLDYPAYGAYGAYGGYPISPMTYSYAYSPMPWFSYPFILNTNRIPIPPRMISLNAAMRRFKFPGTFLDMDDWAEDWEKEEEQLS